MAKMQEGNIKDVYSKVMTRRYACAITLDKAATMAYAIGAIGFKRILMAMSKEYWCQYKKLKHKAISVHEVAIVPDYKYVNSLLMKIEEVGVSPLTIDSKVFIDRIKKIISLIKDWEKESMDMTCEAIENIQHYYPNDFRLMTDYMECHDKWIKFAKKVEATYDKYEWQAPFIMQHQKIMHDKAKKGKYYK